MRRWESQWLSIGESSGTLVAFWSNVNEKLCHVVRSRCPEKQREAEGEDAFLYWVIVNREDEDHNVERLGPVTYGKVPQGYKQVYPERGEAPQLVEGERYNIRIATNNANGVDKFFVMYSLRHTHCALRIMTGDNFLAIARDMGTSISQIDATYGHVPRPVSQASSERLAQLLYGT